MSIQRQPCVGTRACSARHWQGLSDPLVAYAVKANPNPAVLSILAREGLGADIVSIGEYRAAKAAGMTPETILFSGVGKTADEMAEALAGGLLQFNLESVEEAHTLVDRRLCNGPRGTGRASDQSGCRGRNPRQDHDGHGATISSAYRPQKRSPPSRPFATSPISGSPASPSISAASSPALPR